MVKTVYERFLSEYRDFALKYHGNQSSRQIRD